MISSDASNIEKAEYIVHAYGELLADINEVGTAYPLSLLPYDKDFIRQAILTLLWEIHGMAPEIRAGLTSGYVFLEQFIPDRQYATLAKGQAVVQSGDLNHYDWVFADEASSILVQIKTAMENALLEMRLFLH
jgi:hypothetical protein